MLVLSRKKNESIVVNDSIVITVIEIRGDKVRLGIEAPREVSIHRSEVLESIQRQLLNAAGSADSGVLQAPAGLETIAVTAAPDPA